MITDEDVAKKFIALRDSAASRGLEFNLTLRSVRNMLRAQRCYYTRVELRRDVDADHPQKLTIDRKDASLGYILGNVVACCHEFNKKKGALTRKDIEILAKKVL